MLQTLLAGREAASLQLATSPLEGVAFHLRTRPSHTPPGSCRALRSAPLKSFPVKIPTLWRQAFPGLLLGTIVARLSLWVQGEPFTLPSTLPLMAIAAVLVVLIYYLQPTLAGERGLKAMNVWGVRKFVNWSDIESVNFARWYLVQPSLRLVDRGGRTYWIAKDTKDLGALHALAVKHGGASHPLARALETPLHAL